MVTIAEITLADEPTHWESLGFSVSDAAVQIGSVRIALAGQHAGRGILGWSLRDIASTQLDGLPTAVADARVLPTEEPAENPSPAEKPSPTEAPSPAETREGRQDTQPPSAHPEAHEHPNGITTIDHVVAMSPDLDRSVVALQAAGLDLRRIREQPTPAGAPRQAFFRLGEVILELVQEPAEVVAARPDGANGPARFWGLALLSDDLEHTVAQLGEHSSEIRMAVQPGRRIATLRRSAGLAAPVALMSRAID